VSRIATTLPAWLGGAALVLWVAFEVVLRSRSGEARSFRAGGQDRGSTLLVVAAYAAALVLPWLLPRVGALPPAARWVGVGAAFAGLALRAWSMRALGAAYTRTLRTAGGLALVIAGPYRLIRHPGYAGSLLVWLGTAAARGSGAALILVVLLVVGAYAWRIRVEEVMLAERFGAEYRAYAARTRRLIPGVY